MNNSNIRIRTTVDGGDKYIKMPIEQDFDNLEILSLKISQEDAYKRYCSDYGVVVGRVIANGGVGVPNAKVSVFIPLSDEDADNDVISGIYPYKDIFIDKNGDGKRYNLLPSYNDTDDECFTPVGSFPSKRQVLDNDVILEVYEKYYKFTTTTNDSGDYMLFGVPTGSHTLHLDVDLSNIGFLSQKPYDFIREGSPKEKFETTTKFKNNEDLNSLPQINTSNKGILVKPFWGDTENCEIGITRVDFELSTRIEPHAFFIGSIFGDDEKNRVSQRCRLKKDIGKLCETSTGEGTIEMIRKRENGTIEKFAVEGGRPIDDNGAWAYQIPMNLDYMVTNEFGELVPSEQRGVGVPTRTRTRFRISMDVTGSEGRRLQRASYLIPNHPDFKQVGDYTFGEDTPDDYFYDMHWNNIYTVRNFIGRFQALGNSNIRDHLGIKDVDDCGDKTPFPYNHYDGDINPLFGFLCVIFSIFNTIIYLLNISIIGLINVIIGTLNSVLSIFNLDLPYVPCIGLECDDKRFAPGCSNNNGFNAFKNVKNGNGEVTPYSNDRSFDGFLDCKQLELAEALDFIEYDFYNDWINGTLYFPLFKFKVKKNGKTKFCDYDLDSNRNNYIVDNCTNPDNSNGKGILGGVIDMKSSGLVKYIEDEQRFYYAATFKTGDKYPLLMTDISNLGSINDKIRIDGVRTASMINQIGESTYRKPPFSDDIDDSGNLIAPSVEEMLLKVTCLGIRTKKDWCTHTKRICEIGMSEGEDLDEDDTIPADRKIDNNDIDAISPRAKFIYNNSNIPTPFQSGYLSTTGGAQEIATFGDAEYNAFRDVKTLEKNIKVSQGNSLYFYFGIVPGKTAIQKFNSKYNLPCETIEINDFIINVTNVINNTVINGNVGEIEIEVIGGSGDYIYEWYDENGVLIPSTTNTITGLLAGVYSVTVTDVISGNQLVREITVTEPLSLAASIIDVINPVPLDASTGVGGVNSGEIIVSPRGGQPDYTIELYDVTGTNLLDNTPSTVTTAGYTFDGLTFGDYVIRVIDSAGLSEDIPVTIAEPDTLTIEVNNDTTQSYDTACGDDNGIISISIGGGTTPYSAVKIINSGGVDVNAGNPVTFYIDTIPAGTYNVSVVDAFNVESNIVPITIDGSNQLIIDSVTTAPVMSQTQITVNINATANGDGDLLYSLFEQGNSTPIFDTILSNTFLGNFSGNYTIQVEDESGCIKEEFITI